MIHIEFSQEEIDALHDQRRYHPHARVRQRCEVVYLKALGYSHHEIGRITQLSQPTLREYLRRYQAGGLEKLQELHFHQPTSELEAHRQAIEEEFRQRPPRTLHEAADRIEQLTGVRRSPTQVRAFLQQVGIKRLKVGPVPAKADPQQQTTFVEQALEPRLEEAQQGQRHVFFVDAAHFVWGAFLGFLWCFERLFLPTPSGRKRLSVLGALHAISQQVVTVVTEDYINAQTVMELLRQLQTTYGTLPITLVLDNARYQRCHAVMSLAAELGIELLFLPPYAPNLNLIERLWKFVKQTCLYSQYYPTFAAFKETILDCLQETHGKHQADLATLLTLHFQIMGSETS